MLVNRRQQTDTKFLHIGVCLDTTSMVRKAL